MIGPIAVIVFMVVMFPVGLFLSAAVLSALFGEFGTRAAEAEHEGSELVELSLRR